MKRFAVLLSFCLTTLITSLAYAQTSNPSNTVVRFRIHYGYYLLGDIDVELFDQAKPVTVSNFLAYVRDQRYHNSILHRLIPNFVLQGGEWNIPYPYSDEVMEYVSRVPTFSPITNEFLVGPRLTNSFGTIAMAKLGGDPDSATSSWFINLAYNGPGSLNDLDGQNGGFTVFGRVKKDASRLLAYFNTFVENDGIINMTRTSYTNSCPPLYMAPDGLVDYPFSDLPVQFTGLFCPFYNDLYRVQMIVVSDGDLTPPKLTVVSPRENGSVTNDVIIQGTITENAAMGTIRVYLGTNDPVVATLSNNTWSATLAGVPPGTNTFIVEAVDEAGNLFGVARRFFRSELAPLNLQVFGSGVVSGATNEQMLELGRGYTLTAKPNAGNLFAGWTGPLTQSGTVYSFIMDTNLAITATFVTNLFPVVKGTYNGLFFDPAGVEQQGAGAITLTVGDFGAYSARLSSNGKTHSFRGSFSPDGRETNLISRVGTNGLLIRLALDLEGGSDQITGSITNNQGLNVNTNFSWLAQVQANRVIVRSADQPAAQAGKYTFLLPADPESAAGPPGSSYGTANITSKGSGTFTGSLADNTKIAHKASLSKDGAWPFYLALQKGKGALIGWINFTNETTTDFSGLLNWFKQGQLSTRYYPKGFTNQATILGSRFVAPTTGSRLIELTNASVAFAGASFADDFANNVLIDAVGKVTNAGTNRLSLSISRSTGVFTGSVTPPTTSPPLSFKGAILQKQNRGAGFFLNIINSGSVELQGD